MKKTKLIQLVLLGTLMASCKVTPSQSPVADTPDFYDDSLYCYEQDSCAYLPVYPLNYNIPQPFYSGVYSDYSSVYFRKAHRNLLFGLPAFIRTHYILRGGFSVSRTVAS